MQVLKEEVRQKILQCAERLFAEKGFFSTSIGEVAESARISKGNIYLYYKNKQALFDAVISEDTLEMVSIFIANRIKALLNNDNSNEKHRIAGKELISFLIANRSKVLILLNPENSGVTGAMRIIHCK